MNVERMQRLSRNRMLRWLCDDVKPIYFAIMWFGYRYAVAMRRLGRTPRAYRADRQAEMDEVWNRLLTGLVDDWRNRHERWRTRKA